MKFCFGDASYFIALLNRADNHHATALAVSQSPGLRIITTGFVITEVADASSRPAWRPNVLRMIATLRNSPDHRVLPPTQSLFNAGLELFSQRLDKSWSLTDCISFVVMQREGINDALTADHHFEQAGFKTLLK